jgi:hypothetical protein
MAGVPFVKRTASEQPILPNSCPARHQRTQCDPHRGTIVHQGAIAAAAPVDFYRTIAQFDPGQIH